MDRDGNCLIHALVLCQERNYQSLPREERLRRAIELRRRAAMYIDSQEFMDVMDNAEANSTQSQLRILQHQVSEARRLLEMTGGDGRAAEWLDETAIAVIALMERLDIVVLRHAAHSIPNYMTEPIPYMEFFPARFVQMLEAAALSDLLGM